MFVRVGLFREGLLLSVTSRQTGSTGARPAKVALRPCGYVGSGNVPCRFKAAPGHRYCFWHNVEAPKTGPLVGPLLVRLVRENVNMEGFQLPGVDLECRQLQGAQLVKANLENAHLFRANLDDAHLFSANLKNATLFKASLVNANLRSANISGANLLGANIKGTRLEGSDLGRKSIVVNERKGNEDAHRGNHIEALKHWHEAEEIYLALLNNFREAGRNDEASEMFYRMMVVKRKVMPAVSVARWGSWCMDVLCGYGERPMRIISSCLVLILGAAFIFFFLGIKDSGGQTVGVETGLGMHENIKAFANCVYFSVITMTTTGYGDFTPNEVTRSFAGAEAFIGSFLMAVFILVFSRKMMR